MWEKSEIITSSTYIRKLQQGQEKITRKKTGLKPKEPVKTQAKNTFAKKKESNAGKEKLTYRDCRGTWKRESNRFFVR